MKKKIYYYKISLSSISRGIEFDDLEVKKCLKKAINSNNNTTIKLSPITNENITNTINMDIISEDENFLFFRIGRLVDDNNGLLRHIETNEVTEIGDENKFLEVYTYAFIDYKYCIMGYLNSLQAPKPNTIQGLTQYLTDDMYTFTLENISSENTVASLYKGKSVLSSFEGVWRNPSPVILREIGLSQTKAEKILRQSSIKCKFIITSDKLGIATENNLISTVCEALRGNNGITNKKVKGKHEEGIVKEYSFGIENFNSEIDIPTTRVDNGKIIRYKLSQIAQEFKVRSQHIYLKERKEILLYANIKP